MTNRVTKVTDRFFPDEPLQCYLSSAPVTEGKDGTAMKEAKGLMTGSALLAAFALWTVLIRCVDVRAIGPRETSVGFAALNGWFHRLTGVHWWLYTMTDWLGLVPILVCCCYGMTGFVQWIRRKNLFRVDADVLLLGIYYLLVIFGYLFFETVPINHRPVLINGCLEASYPSSTTLLVLSVMPTFIFQTDRRCRNSKIRKPAAASAILFCLFMVIGRLISGVHWITDIIGSVLLSGGLYLLYYAAVARADRKKNEIIRREKEHGV